MASETSNFDYLTLKNEGNALYSAGDFLGAVQKYSKALIICTDNNTDRTTLLKNRAAAYLNLQEYQKVIEDTTAALEITPSDIKALYRRCQAYEQLGKYNEAFEDARAVNRLNPQNSAIQPYLRQLQEIKPVIIEESSETVLSKTSNLDYLTLKDEGNALYSAGDFPAAVQKYSKCLKLCTDKNTDRSTLLKNRAAAYLSLREYQKVVDDTTAALEITPSDIKALYRRCQAYEQLGKYNEAFEDARAVNRLNPQNSAIQPYLRRLQEIVNESNDDALDINSLPNEIILKIFGYLKQNQLGQIARYFKEYLKKFCVYFEGKSKSAKFLQISVEFLEKLEISSDNLKIIFSGAVSNTDKKKLCALIILLSASSKKKEVKNRKLWSRQWLLKRKKLGCYENLMRELALQDKEGYRQWIRMDTATFEYLLEKVTPLIIKQNTVMREAIPAGERLALTLRYLATGETQRSLAFTFRIAQNTISGIIPVVCRAIFEVLKDEYLQTPDEIHKWKKIASRFQSLWNFPNCIGALDGKHVKIVPPPQSGSSYYNYKGDFSIVLLALVDADLRFIYVDVGTNGRISDGGVWSKSTLKKAFDLDLLNIPSPDYLPGTNEKVPFVIVADDAFPLGNNLMKPFPGAGRKTLPHQQRIYNYRVSRARRVVENAFGILAARFQIFKGKIPLHVSTTKLITLAACVLHNLLRSKVYSRYIPAGTLDREDMRTGEIKTGDWRDYRSSLSNFKKSPFKSADVAKEIQRRFCNYFNSVGAVPWQNKMCDLH